MLAPGSRFWVCVYIIVEGWMQLMFLPHFPPDQSPTRFLFLQQFRAANYCPEPPPRGPAGATAPPPPSRPSHRRGHGVLAAPHAGPAPLQLPGGGGPPAAGAARGGQPALLRQPLSQQGGRRATPGANFTRVVTGPRALSRYPQSFLKLHALFKFEAWPTGSL